jgi:hypothetical protein
LSLKKAAKPSFSILSTGLSLSFGIMLCPLVSAPLATMASILTHEIDSKSLVEFAWGKASRRL